MLVGLTAKQINFVSKKRRGCRLIKQESRVTVLSMVATQKVKLNKHFSKVAYLQDCTSFDCESVTNEIKAFIEQAKQNFEQPYHDLKLSQLVVYTTLKLSSASISSLKQIQPTCPKPLSWNIIEVEMNSNMKFNTTKQSQDFEPVFRFAPVITQT